MALQSFNFGALDQPLQKDKEEGVTFEDKALSWNTADDVKDVVDSLEKKKIVHYLKLEGNTLGIEAAAAIGKALVRHPEFRKALWKNLFTGRLKSEIPQALKHLGNGLIMANAHLVVLDLSDNALGPNGMVGLEELLRSPVCYSLQELKLNNCGLGIGGGQMLTKAILDSHRSSSAVGTPLNLKVFITGRNRLENDGAKAISKIFSTLKTFEKIVLLQNSIYHEGIAALAESFKANPNLQVLNLNDNILTPKGAASLADAFEHTPSLREINFGDCLLKTDGAYHFAEALEGNHQQLEIVDLGFNEIGPDGGLALVAALQNKPNLQRLNLDGNMFGYEGRESIMEVMQGFANPTALESLDEDQSECDDEDDDGESRNLSDEDGNDTTEEADEDEEYGEYDEDIDDADDAAYTTTPAFTTKLFTANESFVSSKSNVAQFTDYSIVKENINEATAESFCLSQTPYILQMFESINVENKHEAFKSIINQFTDDNFLVALVFTTLKCAHLAQASTAALQLAMILFKECFEYAVKVKQERRILNFLLIQLGLLHSEEKFRSPYNLKSCRFALHETLNKQKCSSELMKNTFKSFLKNAEF